MRDGLPVIALVVSVVALVVALAGVVTGGPSETPDAPEEMLKAATAQLSSVAEERKAARREFERLARDVARAVEAGPAGQGGGLDPTEVRDTVKREVDAALRKRLTEEIEKAKAVARKPTAAKSSPKKPVRPVVKKPANGGEAAPVKKKVGATVTKSSGKLKAFNDMQSEIEKALALDGNRSGRVRAVLTGLRDELNKVFREERAGRIKREERDVRAAAARQRADVQLTGILGAKAFERFKRWRSTSETEYVKRFFGP